MKITGEHLLSADFADEDAAAITTGVKAAIDMKVGVAVRGAAARDLGDLLARLAEKYPSENARHPCVRCGAPACTSMSLEEGEAAAIGADVMLTRGADGTRLFRTCGRCTALLIVMMAEADHGGA